MHVPNPTPRVHANEANDGDRSMWVYTDKRKISQNLDK